jgi:hypothetical protein
MIRVFRDTHSQWNDRNNALQKCEMMIKQKSTLCVRPPGHQRGEVGVSHAQFLRFVVKYPFVVCTHGGGIDPSPKVTKAYHKTQVKYLLLIGSRRGNLF